MLAAYGEGAERAFFRLFETILKVSSSRYLFLCAGKPVQYPLILHGSLLARVFRSWDPAVSSSQLRMRMAASRVCSPHESP